MKQGKYGVGVSASGVVGDRFRLGKGDADGDDSDVKGGAERKGQRRRRGDSEGVLGRVLVPEVEAQGVVVAHGEVSGDGVAGSFGKGQVGRAAVDADGEAASGGSNIMVPDQEASLFRGEVGKGRGSLDDLDADVAEGDGVMEGSVAHEHAADHAVGVVAAEEEGAGDSRGRDRAHMHTERVGGDVGPVPQHAGDQAGVDGIVAVASEGLVDGVWASETQTAGRGRGSQADRSQE